MKLGEPGRTVWVGDSQACDESGQEVDDRSRRKPPGLEVERGERWKALYPATEVLCLPGGSQGHSLVL